jgi:hypothetical protein
VGIHRELPILKRSRVYQRYGMLSALAALVACGRSVTHAPVPEGLAFWREHALVACEVAYACARLNENSAQRCRLYAEAIPPDPRLDAALRRGTVQYHPARAAECFETMRDTCITENVGACQHTLIGRVSLGEACTVSEECEDGARCAGVDESGTNSSCVPDIPRDDVCGALIPCPALPGEIGLCEDVDDTSRCYVATKIGHAALGESCGASDPNEAGEVVLTRCDSYLRCDEGVCTLLLEAGDPCESHDDCGPDATCAWDTCVPIVVRDHAGDSCDFDDVTNPRVFEDCNVDHLACVHGECQVKGDGSEGTVCDPRQSLYACDDGLDCDSSSSLCVPRP